MPTVYIGNLSKYAKERDVERFFRNYGRIRDIDLKSGYGFVEFDHYRDADDAIYDLNGKELDGERVILEHARGMSKRRSRPERNVTKRRPAWLDKYGPPVRTNYRMIIKNLSSRVSWQDLKDLMRQAGEVTYADAHKLRRNEGIVEFASKSDMEKAAQRYDNFELKGRAIRIEIDEDYESSRRRSKEYTRHSKSKSRSRSYSVSSSKDSKTDDAEDEERSRKRRRKSRSSSSRHSDGRHAKYRRSHSRDVSADDSCSDVNSVRKRSKDKQEYNERNSRSSCQKFNSESRESSSDDSKVNETTTFSANDENDESAAKNKNNGSTTDSVNSEQITRRKRYSTDGYNDAENSDVSRLHSPENNVVNQNGENSLNSDDYFQVSESAIVEEVEEKCAKNENIKEWIDGVNKFEHENAAVSSHHSNETNSEVDEETNSNVWVESNTYTSD